MSSNRLTIHEQSSIDLQNFGRDTKTQLKNLDKELIQNSANTEILYLKGNLLYTLEKYEDAISIYQKITKLNKNDLRAWYKIGKSYNDLENHTKALDLLNQGYKLANPFEDKELISLIWSEIAYADYMKEDYDTAAHDGEFSVHHDESNDFGWAIMARAGSEAFPDQLQKSLEHVEKAISLNPNESFNLDTKGSILSKLEKYDEAVKWYEKALKIEPDDPDTLHDLGLCFKELKEYKKAEGVFKNSIDFSGESHPFLHLADIYEAQTNFDKALKMYNEGLKIDPNSVELLQNKGALLSSLDEEDKALECYNKALTFDPKNLELITNKVISLKKLTSDEEAFRVIEAGLVIDPNYTDLLSEKVEILNLSKNFYEGLALGDRLLQGDPKNPLFLELKGRILGNLGRFQEALDLFNEAINHGGSMEAHENRITALLSLGKLDQAIKRIDELMGKGNDQEWLIVKAAVLDQKHQTKQTFECIEKALKIDNKDPLVLQGVCAFYVKHNQFKKALPLVNRLLRQNPKNYSVLCMKGLILATQGQYQTGLNLIDNAIKLEPKYGFSWFARGWILLMNNEEKEALSCFMFAVSLDINVLKWIKEYPQTSQFTKTSDWKKFQNLIKGELNRNVN